MAHRVFILFVGLLVLFSKASDTDLTGYWTSYCRDVVDSADLDYAVKILLKCRIADLDTLRTVSRTDLTTCGMSLGDAARIKAKADLPTAGATSALSPSKSVDVVETKPVVENATAEEVSTATTINISIEINNSTVEAGKVANAAEDTSKEALEPSPPVRRKRALLGRDSVDWGSVLVGVCPTSSIPRYERILKSRGLDTQSCTKLDVSGLHSIGFEKEIAVRLLTKLVLSDWLKGVVNKDDIPGVIRILLKSRVYLPTLRKHSVDDLASYGLALGDATRIYKKAHPELANKARGRPFHVDVTEEQPAETVVEETSGVENTGNTDETLTEETSDVTEETSDVENTGNNEATVATTPQITTVPIVVKIVLSANGETVVSNVSTSSEAATIPVNIQLADNNEETVANEEEVVDNEEEVVANEEEVVANEEEVVANEEEVVEDGEIVNEETIVAELENNEETVTTEPVEQVEDVTEEVETIPTPSRRHIRDFARRNAASHSFGRKSRAAPFKLLPSQRNRVNLRRM